MIFAVAGGDDRFVRLCRLLEDDGHTVRPFALEKALKCAGSSEEMSGAEAVVLPLPCIRSGTLNAPLSDKRRSVSDLLLPVTRGTPVLAGMADGIAGACQSLGLPLHDYYAREDFAVKNAALTAEGAISLMLRERSRALCRSRVLICGFGRIGRMLCVRLAALGAQVAVAARSPSDLAWAEGFGCRAVPLDAITSEDYAFVLNTIPQTVFGEEQLRLFPGASLIELASAPYGFDLDAAERLGARVTLAPGLPSVTAPESAAEALRDTLYKILEESL